MKRSWNPFSTPDESKEQARLADLPVPGPTLIRYGRDLTRVALATRPLTSREDEVAEVFEVLLRWRHNNALILGRPGAGKTALMTEVARQMALGIAPTGLVGRGVVELNMQALVAGASMRGQLEERTVAVVRELQSYHGALVAVFDDLLTLLTMASTGGVDLLRLFGNILETSEIPILATVDSDLLREHADLKHRLDAYFQPVHLNEPTPTQTLAMLKHWADEIEVHHGVSLTPAALEHATHLAGNYLKTRAFTGAPAG